MNFLNKSMQQIGELFKSMSPAARVTAGLLLAVVVISLVYLFHFQGTSAEDYLLSARAFSPTELTAMEAAFSQAGLNDYDIEGSKVRVPRSQRALYLAALAEHNALPQNFDSILSEALSTRRPFESQASWEARVEFAKQQLVAQMVSNMEGVETATVVWDEVQGRGLRATRKVTALVSVQPVGGGRLDGELVESIRGTVAAAKAGLSTQDVTVTDLGSGQYYPSSGDDATALYNTRYAQIKRQYEQDWQKRILDQLTFIPGVQVGVNVELDPQIGRNSWSSIIDPRVVPIRSSEQRTSETNNFAETGGQPGVVPNVGGLNQPAVISEGATQSQVETSQADQENVVGRELVQDSQAGFVPKLVTVSVAVPSDYYVSLWEKLNPPVEGEEAVVPDDGVILQLEAETVTKIEEQVVQLLPKPPAGENLYPQVQVTSFERIVKPAPEPEGYGMTVTDWLSNHGSQVGMMVVGLFGLLMLRGVMKGGSAPEPETAATQQETPLRIHESEEPLETDEEPAAAPKRKRRFASGGPNLRDELADMVREDPDTAADILKSWISDAA